MTAFARVISAKSSTDACFPFTKKDLDALPMPHPHSRNYFRDSRVRGLQLVAYATGRKSFVLFRKIKGRPERILIGPYPDVTIEQARGRASEMNAAIASGENPADEIRQLTSADATLQDAFSSFLELYKKKKRKTWKEDENQFRRYLDWDKSPRWKLRKLSAIRLSDIESLHIQIGEENGPYAANRLLALLRSVLNFAMKHDWSGPNPAIGVSPFPEEQRERFIEPDELPRFWKALHSKATKTDFRDYVLLSLYTGARRANVLSARWEEVDLSGAKWTVPGTKTKNRKPMSVALPPEAVEILKQRKRQARTEWVFPSTHALRKSKSGHFEEPKSQWKELLARARIKNLRIHDLRRTLGSYQASAGASLLVIGKSLGHLNQASTQVYARMNLDPVRTSVSAATAGMVAAARARNGSRSRK